MQPVPPIMATDTDSDRIALVGIRFIAEVAPRQDMMGVVELIQLV